jgi:hypothetical protein
MHAAFAPFAKLGNHVLCKENDGRGPADELVVFRIGIRGDQPEHCGAVGRSNRHQPMTGLKAGIKSQIESELIQVKGQTAILIFHKNIDRVDAQVGILPVQADVHIRDRE